MSSLTERVADRQRRRRDPQEAEVSLLRLIPDSQVRQVLVAAMGESISEAHTLNPGAWEVTLDLERPFVRHNVGGVFVLSYEPDRVYIALRVEALAPEALKRLKSAQREAKRFKVLPDVRFFDLSPRDAADLWAALKPGHLEALRLAASGYRRSPFYRAHSPGVLAYIGSALGRTLPEPEFQVRDTVEELVALVRKRYPDWSSFDHPAFVADELEYKRKTVEKASHALSKEELSALLARGDSDEFIRRLDSLGKDKNLLFRGVPMAGDLGILYQESLDKSAFCSVMFDLLHGAGDAADRLAKYLEWVEAKQLPSKWTFPTYFLWACHPESEAFVKPSVAAATLKLLGSTLQFEDPSAEAYAEYRQLILEQKGALAAFGPKDMTDVQGFLYVAAHAAAGTGRIWKIATEENGRMWERWRSKGIASVGWSEMGDVSGLTRRQFDERRDKVLLERPHRKKAGLDQVWRFSQIEVGDRVVANAGTSLVLGIGTVTGPYFFVPGEEHGHRIPVEWDDVRRRKVDEQGWRRTLIELTPETLDRIQGAPTDEGRDTGGGLDDGPTPVGEAAFTKQAFDLLSQLRATPTREFYLGNKEAFAREVEGPFQKLLADVVARLPKAITEYMETERNIFARILKNDWGRGGAWPFYWGALYPKEGRRIEDAQLFLSIDAESLEFGFYLGQYGGAKEEAFRAKARRHSGLLARVFEGYAGVPLEYGEKHEPQQPARETPSGWREWLATQAGDKISTRARLRRDEVLRLPSDQVAATVADVFKSLFPLVYFVDDSDPTANVSLYLGDELGGDPKPVQPVYPLPTMAADCSFDEKELAFWVRAIERKGQAILYGPPGTGKTFVAQALGRHIVGGGDGFLELVQFHPSYAYEDFILGIRPKTLPSGDLIYENAKGRFIEFCERARERSGKCVLIIDEINRANLSRVFGELMYLLEYRTGEVPLAGGVRFQIPANVHIIGTMNTADRSIALVDHALRRRFAFLRLQPNYDVLMRYHAQRETAIPVDKLVTTLKALNNAINNSHYEVGISFFLNPSLPEHIEHIWRMEVEPYLEEYFFDQESKVNEFRWEKVRERLGLGS